MSKEHTVREFEDSDDESSQNGQSSTVREYGKNPDAPATDEDTVLVPTVDSEGDDLKWVERDVNNLTDFEQFWTFSTMPVEGNLRDFVRVLVSACYALDLSIDELYDQRFMATATREELERIGARVNAQRRQGEEDPTYRRRVQTRYEQRSSRATFEDIASLLKTLLGINDANISCAEDEGPKTISITLPSAVVSDSPFTIDQIETEVKKALSPETSLTVVTDDTFVFSESDTSDKGAGFGEGRWA